MVLAIGGWNSNSLQRPLFLAVRLASWNQILDPWVYILLRQAMLRQLLRLLPLRGAASCGSATLSQHWGERGTTGDEYSSNVGHEMAQIQGMLQTPEVGFPRPEA